MKRFLFLCILPFIAIYINSAYAQNEVHSSKIVISVDLNKEKELQAEVDNGHQPWRLEPIDVAHAALVAGTAKDVKYSDCRLKSQIDSEAIVLCKNKKIYSVRLKRLIRNNGIWTATEIIIEE